MIYNPKTARYSRIQCPSEIPNESIYVHKRIIDGFMKQVGKKLNIDSIRVDGGKGGKLIIHYTTRFGTRGMLELNDLGPKPQ